MRNTDSPYITYTSLNYNNQAVTDRNNIKEPVQIPYMARSLFAEQLDIIIKRHLAELSIARDNIDIESNQRGLLDSYIRNAKDFVNTWSNSFLVTAMLSPEQLKDLWSEIREKNNHSISFIFKILNELKMLYPPKEFQELVTLISSSFTIFYKAPDVNDLVMDKEAASKFITQDQLFNILMEDQWLIVFLGITLLDFIHD